MSSSALLILYLPFHGLFLLILRFGVPLLLCSHFKESPLVTQQTSPSWTIRKREVLYDCHDRITTTRTHFIWRPLSFSHSHWTRPTCPLTGIRGSSFIPAHTTQTRRSFTRSSQDRSTILEPRRARNKAGMSCSCSFVIYSLPTGKVCPLPEPKAQCLKGRRA